MTTRFGTVKTDVDYPYANSYDTTILRDADVANLVIGDIITVAGVPQEFLGGGLFLDITSPNLAKYDHVVADDTARLALTGMTIGDTIFVEDLGISYKADSATTSVPAIVGGGSVATTKAALTAQITDGDPAFLDEPNTFTNPGETSFVGSIKTQGSLEYNRGIFTSDGFWSKVNVFRSGLGTDIRQYIQGMDSVGTLGDLNTYIRDRFGVITTRISSGGVSEFLKGIESGSTIAQIDAGSDNTVVTKEYLEAKTVNESKLAQYDYVVADDTARLALTGMTVNDTIFVEDSAVVFTADSATTSTAPSGSSSSSLDSRFMPMGGKLITRTITSAQGVYTNTGYTVPAGKVFILTSLTNSNPGSAYLVDVGTVANKMEVHLTPERSRELKMVFQAGDTVYYNAGGLMFGQTVAYACITGIEVDMADFFNIKYTNAVYGTTGYTVPAGKNLYILSTYADAHAALISIGTSGHEMGKRDGYTSEGLSFNAGDTIFAKGTMWINCVLVDA